MKIFGTALNPAAPWRRSFGLCGLAALICCRAFAQAPADGPAASEAPPTPPAAAVSDPGASAGPNAADTAADASGGTATDQASAGDAAAAADSGPAPDAVSEPANWFELELEVKDLLEDGDTAAASALSDRLLELAAAEFGETSTEYAETLRLVADAEKRNAEYDPAADHGLEAIEIYRQIDGPFAATLIDPYVELGDIYDAAGDYLNALPAYEEARSLSRRTSGLLNMEQIPILDRMSATSESLGQMVDAQNYQKDALELVERTSEPYSAERVAAVLRYGIWLRIHNLFQEEMQLYNSTEKTVADQFGEDSLETVPLLLARANSFRAQGITHPLGTTSLAQAQEIVDANPAEPLLTAEVYRDIGDWESAFNQSGTDGAAYLHSWQVLGELEDADALRDRWYGDALTYFTLTGARSQRGFSAEPDAPTGHLTIRFTVLPTGLTTDVEVTSIDPPGLAAEAFTRQFRASRFRPQIRDGKLIATRRGFNVEFRYDPKRYE